VNILVTGGGGFIGSHLVDLLLLHGHSVCVLDNFSTGQRDNLPLSNPQLRLVTGDIRDLNAVNSVMQGVDAIVHLAAVASVQASVDDPIGTHEVNLVGTLNLLEAARKYAVKRFVFASSAAVYGDVKTLPVSEDITLSPLTPYAADKLSSEYYIDFYRRQHGLQPVVFRFFNIFGPRQDPSSPYSGVISIFMERAIAELPITVFGDGEQSRDFVYVADLVELLTRAVESDQQFIEPMNVGNGHGTNLNQLLDLIRNFSAKKLDVSYTASRSGDIRHSLADNSRLRQLMKYESRYPVEIGLRKTYEWYQGQEIKAV
jgi:UDP-glucose 4-epimerase